MCSLVILQVPIDGSLLYVVYSYVQNVLTEMCLSLQQGCLATSAILAVEIFPTEQRNFAMNAIEFFWVFGYISLTPFAYFIRNWRWLQLAITLPLTLTILFYWFVTFVFIDLKNNNRANHYSSLHFFMKDSSWEMFVNSFIFYYIIKRTSHRDTAV